MNDCCKENTDVKCSLQPKTSCESIMNMRNFMSELKCPRAQKLVEEFDELFKKCTYFNKIKECSNSECSCEQCSCDFCCCEKKLD